MSVAQATLRSSSRKRKAEYSILAMSVLLAVVYAYGQSNLEFIGFFSNVITPFEALAAFAMAILMLKTYSGDKGGGMSRVYASYSLGIGLWFLAECTWTTYTLLVRIEIPYPSIADLFWLVGYIPLLVAFLLQAWPFREVFGSKKQISLTLTMFVMSALILIVTIPPLFEPNQDPVTLAVSLAYPFLDTLLLAVAIPVFFVFRKGSYWRPTLFVILGIMLQLVADLLFNQAFYSGTYFAGSLTDLIFDYSYLMLALGFYKGLKPNLY